jgi:hypothetical protein
MYKCANVNNIGTKKGRRIDANDYRKKMHCSAEMSFVQL